MNEEEHLKDPTSRALDRGNRLSENEIDRAVEFYAEKNAERANGPLFEGIDPRRLREALETDSENMYALEVKDEDGEKIIWPLLVPVEYRTDYNQDFFSSHYPDRPSYFYTLPPLENADSESISRMGEIAQHLKDEEAIIAGDYLARENEEVQNIWENIANQVDLNIMDITPESKAWGMEYGLPKALHYEGKVKIVDEAKESPRGIDEAIRILLESGEVETLPGSGPTILSSEQLLADDGKFLDQVWEIYNDQFTTLIEDHPLLGKQPKEELAEVLLDKDTVNIAYMHDGEIAGYLYFVNNIGSCPWLNEEYYRMRHENDNEWLVHYPGIVVAKDKAQQGMGIAQGMMDVATKAVVKSGKDMVLTFLCSNVSSTYIPKIAENVIGANPNLELEKDENGEVFVQDAEYKYQILEVTD